KEVLKAQEQAGPLTCKVSQWGRRPAWMSSELFLRLQEKKRIYLLWKKERATRKEYKEVVKMCREKIRKAKAQLELNLAAGVKRNKKLFYKYISSKRKTRENFHSLLDEEIGRASCRKREWSYVRTGIVNNKMQNIWYDVW